jgi:starch phosphorylase
MTKQQQGFYEKLHALARNYWWCWQPEVVAIFRDLEPIRWRELDHNPVLLLDEFTPERLELRGREAVLHSRVNYAYRRWQEYMTSKQTWGDTHTGLLGHNPVAYFSAEFGIHESLPNYSGGLGVLAGDHLKSASDLGVPLVAVGLFYQEGYFVQQIDATGWQTEVYPFVQNTRLAIKPAQTAAGDRVIVTVETRTGVIHAQVWQADVGRIKLYLLDCNVQQNTPEDR